MDALYCENPGTVVVWRFEDGPTSNINQLQRVFWALDPSIEGFKSCRLVINLDDAHLYGQYQGTMLVAVRIKVNEQLYPFASL